MDCGEGEENSCSETTTKNHCQCFNDDHEDDADDEADDDHAEDDTDGKQLQWHNTTRTTEGTCYH